MFAGVCLGLEAAWGAEGDEGCAADERCCACEEGEADAVDEGGVGVCDEVVRSELVADRLCGAE